jgi:hypothetical protein
MIRKSGDQLSGKIMPNQLDTMLDAAFLRDPDCNVEAVCHHPV